MRGSGSNNISAIIFDLAAGYMDTRKDFHFKQAHALCDAGDMVFMEDLDYRTSAKGMFGKHMLDAAFGQFRTIVKYVCWKRGKFFAEVDARGTSLIVSRMWWGSKKRFEH